MEVLTADAADDDDDEEEDDENVLLLLGVLVLDFVLFLVPFDTEPNIILSLTLERFVPPPPPVRDKKQHLRGIIRAIRTIRAIKMISRNNYIYIYLS